MRKRKPNGKTSMANPNPSPKNRFQPGNKANPRGAAAHDGKLRAFRKLTGAEFIETASTLLLNGTVADIRKLAADPDAPTLQGMIAAVIVRVLDKGDMAAFDVLLTHLIGKPRVTEEPVTERGNGSCVIVRLPSNGREAPDTVFD